MVGPWHDSTTAVPSPAGFTASEGIVFAMAAPFRRLVRQNWLVPIAAIGTALAERHPLSNAEGRNVILAGRPGPLTVFVNDAVVPMTLFAGTGRAVCFGWDCLYRNNRGGPARVRVTPTGPRHSARQCAGPPGIRLRATRSVQRQVDRAARAVIERA